MLCLGYTYAVVGCLRKGSVVASTKRTLVLVLSPVEGHGHILTKNKKYLRGTMVMKLSDEQARVLKYVEPPNPSASSNNSNNGAARGKVVRITAAAGAGKTTTLLEVARLASEKGHKHIAFVTFNKAAPRDGARRHQDVMSSTGAILEARTLHSAAMSALGRHRQEQEDDDVEDTKILLNEDKFQEKVDDVCQEAVDKFLGMGCYREIRRRCGEDKKKAESARKKVERLVRFFIFKTLINFCRSPMTLEDFECNSKKFG